MISAMAASPSTRYFTFHHDATVVGLWRHTLQRQPRRLDPVERADQLSRRVRVEECFRPLARLKLDETLSVDEGQVVSCGAHNSLTSTACSKRN
jgi:hypothetical protein